MVVEIVKLCPNCEARILNFIKGKSENEIL
jgi:hypothetical protein